MYVLGRAVVAEGEVAAAVAMVLQDITLLPPQAPVPFTRAFVNLHLPCNFLTGRTPLKELSLLLARGCYKLQQFQLLRLSKLGNWISTHILFPVRRILGFFASGGKRGFSLAANTDQPR